MVSNIWKQAFCLGTSEVVLNFCSDGIEVLESDWRRGFFSSHHSVNVTSLGARSASVFKKFLTCFDNWAYMSTWAPVLVWSTCVHATLAQVDFLLLHPNRLWWTWAHQSSSVLWPLAARAGSAQISPTLTWLCQLCLHGGVLRWVILARQRRQLDLLESLWRGRETLSGKGMLKIWLGVASNKRLMGLRELSAKIRHWGRSCVIEAEGKCQCKRTV